MYNQEIEKVKYDTRRLVLEESRSSNIHSFDKHVLVLSSAALAFTFTIVGILRFPCFVSKLAIGSAWSSFSCCIVFTLSSFYFGEKDSDKRILDLDENHKESFKEKTPLKYDTYSGWAKITILLNRCSLALFILGIFSFLIYGLSALTFLKEKEEKMNEPIRIVEQRQPGMKTNGYTPPPAPANQDGGKGYTPPPAPVSPESGGNHTQ